MERYLDSLAARRDLLAGAAATFLNSLRDGIASHGDRVQPIAVIGTPDTENARDQQDYVQS